MSRHWFFFHGHFARTSGDSKGQKIENSIQVLSIQFHVKEVLPVEAGTRFFENRLAGYLQIESTGHIFGILEHHVG